MADLSQGDRVKVLPLETVPKALHGEEGRVLAVFDDFERPVEVELDEDDFRRPATIMYRHQELAQIESSI